MLNIGCHLSASKGYYNMGSNNPVTSDDSQIRFVYKLKEVETVQEANPKW